MAPPNGGLLRLPQTPPLNGTPLQAAQRRLAESEIFQLVDNDLDGQSVRQLAVSWRIHRTTVLDQLKAFGVTIRPAGRWH